MFFVLMCQTVLREGSLVRDFRLSGNPIRSWFFALLLSVNTFLLTRLISANVHHNTHACIYYAQSITVPPPPGQKTAPWMTHHSNHAPANPSLTNRHWLEWTILACGAVKRPIGMVGPVNVGRWHHSAWVQGTSDSHVSPVICIPVDKGRNMW